MAEAAASKTGMHCLPFKMQVHPPDDDRYYPSNKMRENLRIQALRAHVPPLLQPQERLKSPTTARPSRQANAP